MLLVLVQFYHTKGLSLRNKGVPGFNEIRDYDDVIDEVMEWIGRKWTTGMIKMQMREVWPGIKVTTILVIISRARDKIRKLYNIDPNEYKGSQISFYESVIRGKGKLRDKLKAAERLDALFGLENISGVDPADLAAKIRQFRQEMDSMIGDDDGGNKNVGDSETNASIKTKDAAKSGSGQEDNGTDDGRESRSRSGMDQDTKSTESKADDTGFVGTKEDAGDGEQNTAGSINMEPTSGVVDSEKAEIIEELKHCDQVKKDMETQPKKSPDNI